jgi:hypothetical protein
VKVGETCDGGVGEGEDLVGPGDRVDDVRNLMFGYGPNVTQVGDTPRPSIRRCAPTRRRAASARSARRRHRVPRAARR